MKKNLGAIMEYTGEGIEALVAALDDLESAGLIMAEKKIKSVLKCLAYYGEFRTVLAYCNEGFDYAAEKRKALGKAGEYRVLRLPTAPKTLVPLVAGLLVEFDDGREDFITFCADHYPALSRGESMAACCADMLEKFKLAIVSLVVEGVKEEAPLVERMVEFAPDGLQKQTESLLIALVHAVDESSLPDDERKDILLMLEGYSAALDSRDVLMIKAMWLGVKRALATHKLCPKDVDAMEELLRLYLVTK